MSVVIGLFVLLIPLLGSPQGTSDPEGESDPRPAVRPALDLDSLLTPREPGRHQDSLRGGKDRQTWRLDFEKARSEVAQLVARVAEAQEAIRDSARGEWGYSPTGSGAPTDPETLRLRAEIKRDRRSLEAAQGRLRDLEVGASLAEVPDSWLLPVDPPLEPPPAHRP